VTDALSGGPEVAYRVVKQFERAIADFAGAPFGVAVESGTAAIFLCLQYWAKVKNYGGGVLIPSRTYPSVPCSIIHAGLAVEFENGEWSGVYELWPLKIIDAALRFKKGMYQPGTLFCLSFHAKKHLPIGRGGMILTDDLSAAEWLKRARFDGRPEKPLDEGEITMVGWNMYMTPEQAARGLMLLQAFSDRDDLDSKSQGYPDLSKVAAYQ
jgi:dTDP-4-amino-4,6-dideoxygalactose transaminase